MRVCTRAVDTSTARTQPVAPFGRIGSSTCSQVAWQPSSTRSPSTENTVGAPFTFFSSKCASGKRPGTRYAVVGRTTTAATADSFDPRGRRAPSTQGCATTGRGLETARVCSTLPPQPAASSASAANPVAHITAGSLNFSARSLNFSAILTTQYSEWK